MKVGTIQSIIPELPKLNQVEKKNDTGFGNMFTDFISQVSDDQKNAGNLVKGFIQGEEIELHEVMIAGEKAKTSLELLMEIRNKTLDMYKELTRISV